MGPDPDDLIGQVLASRYRLEARLGNGAMGIVYRARHVKVGRLFAVKVLHPQLLDDAKLRRRFAREAELAGSLNHPNLVSVVDVGETPDGLHYLVMEYAEGHTLFELICPGAPWPTARVTAMVRQLCDGLAHAHERGLIHRDFKTENVIVERRDGREIPRIADFGIAILRDEAASPSADRLTTAGMVLGTPSYMAPEQATGGGLDHRVDLFALGVMCFEMLAGCAPFEGDGVDIARANLLSETPVMAVRVPGLVVDRMLEGLTRKLMMKSRDARPESARAVRELLDLIERDREAAAVALGDTLDTLPMPPLTQQGIPLPRQRNDIDETEPVVRPMGRLARLAVVGAAVVLVIAALVIAQRPRRSRAADLPRLAAPAITAPVEVTSAPAPPPPPPRETPVDIAASPTPPAEALPEPPKRADRADRSHVAARSVAPSKPTPLPSIDPPSSATDEPARGATDVAAAAPVPAVDSPTTPVEPHLELSATPHALPSVKVPSTSERVARLYAAVGKRLKALDQARGSAATADLWLVYLRVRINDVIADPVKCAEADTLLQHLDDQIAIRSH